MHINKQHTSISMYKRIVYGNLCGFESWESSRDSERQLCDILVNDTNLWEQRKHVLVEQ